MRTEVPLARCTLAVVAIAVLRLYAADAPASARGTDFQALGRFADPSHFRVAPSYLRPLFVYKDGKRLAISYRCGTCAIRTWRPGECWCCHKYTDLDLREPGEN